jgi:hypothetical protein
VVVVVVSENAAVHADTPAISHVDGLGQREVSRAQLRSQLRGRRNFGLSDPGQFTRGKRITDGRFGVGSFGRQIVLIGNFDSTI